MLVVVHPTQGMTITDTTTTTTITTDMGITRVTVAAETRLSLRVTTTTSACTLGLRLLIINTTIIPRSALGQFLTKDTSTMFRLGSISLATNPIMVDHRRTTLNIATPFTTAIRIAPRSMPVQF